MMYFNFNSIPLTGKCTNLPITYLSCKKTKILIVFLLYSSDGEESACNAGDLGSIPGSGKSSGGRNGNPLQYSYLENPMDRGA